MKKGDKVMINDGSWSRTIRNNELVDGPGGDEYTGTPIKDRKQYTVIETGCSFPNTGSWNSFNNTVIQAIDSGKVVFIEEHFLRPVPPTHKVVIDCAYGNCITYGEIVEISDELYKQIKRETQ